MSSMKEKIRKSFHSKYFKKGSYSAAVTALLLIFLILINYLVSSLPVTYTQLDVTDSHFSAISSTTKEFLQSLDKDVSIYLISDSENVDDVIWGMLKRYEAASSHIKIERKDPSLYPEFASQYTDGELSQNSLVVESEKRSKVIAYSDIYVSKTDYSTYQTKESFEGESRITSAIDYCTTDVLPIVYALEGHGEQTMSEKLQSAITSENIQLEQLDLVTVDAVPEDCSCLLILSPESDFSEDEWKKIEKYAKGGGNLFVTSNYETSSEAFPHFEKLLFEYGVERKEGILVEQSTSNFASQYPYYLIPNVQDTDLTESLAKKQRHVIMPMAQAVTLAETASEDGITVTPLLFTSNSAYIKKAEYGESITKEDGDEEGCFYVATWTKKQTGKGKKSNMVYFSSEFFLNDEMDQYVSGGNFELLTNVLDHMCSKKNALSIAGKNSNSYENLILTAGQIRMYMIIMTIVFPLLCLLLGILIWAKRRKA